MFVTMSRFVVANGLEDEVREAFLARPGKVEEAPGFLRLEVLVPRDRREEFWLLTWWTDEASFETWHRGHSYRDAHAGIPKGLKLVPKETFVRTFDHLCS